jgi:NRPS condensation-like uncharacterized protein
MDESALAYHSPTAFLLRGADTGRLKAAFQGLCDRHESLRTSFVVTNGQVVQRIAQDVEAPVMVMRVADLTDDTRRDLWRDFVRPFDLANAPLARLLLAEGPGSETLLLLDIHHIISDGVSMGVLLEDFAALYLGEAVPVPTRPARRSPAADAKAAARTTQDGQPLHSFHSLPEHVALVSRNPITIATPAGPVTVTRVSQPTPVVPSRKKPSA